MGNFLITLRATAALGFAGLLVGVLLASFAQSLFLAVAEGGGIKALLLSPLSALVVYPFALGMGVLPALILCVPLYAWLRYAGKASYLAAALTGAVPAFLLAIFGDMALSPMFAWFGVVVGLCTRHLERTAVSMAVRSNNSFKPKPLRGSA